MTRAFGPRRAAAPARVEDAEVVLVMGIPGAGKSLVAEDYVARGFVRLNRDERGGSLRELAEALDDELGMGVRRVVLDNTYLTRVSRSYVLEAAARRGVAVRCVWLETPLAQAQVNMVERLLDRYGSLPSPEELKQLARREPGALAPTSQMRALRELEPPSADEGFVSVEHEVFSRVPSSGRAAVIVAAPALGQSGWRDALADLDPTAPHLIYDWRPDAPANALAESVELLSTHASGVVDSALCPHPAGPPTCWCRPPLPGLSLAFARVHGVDLSHSVLVGTAPAHRTLARTLGAEYVSIGGPADPPQPRSKRG